MSQPAALPFEDDGLSVVRDPVDNRVGHLVVGQRHPHLEKSTLVIMASGLLFLVDVRANSLNAF